MVRVAISGAIGFLIAIVSPSQLGAQATSLTITTDGMLGINAGMTRQQVAHLISRRGIYSDADIDGGTFTCNIYNTRNGLAQVMIQKGFVTSVSTDSTRMATTSGARVGATEAALRRLYGNRLRRDENTYEGFNLTLLSTSGNGVRFHLENGRIVSISSDQRGSIELMEGCR